MSGPPPFNACSSRERTAQSARAKLLKQLLEFGGSGERTREAGVSMRGCCWLPPPPHSPAACRLSGPAQPVLISHRG